MNGYLSVSSGWTDGYFEFKVKVLLNAKNGIGSEFVTYFSASPESLFYIRRTKPSGQTFYVSHLRTKPIDLSKPLFNWDLNQYASTVKIDIEEVDRTETTTVTESRSVKFATNFGIEGTILKKIGLKFGASLEDTRNESIQRSYTQGNDELGSVIINFADNVVLSRSSPNSNRYYTRTYEGGWFKLSMEPKRVQ